jgi:SAM-dependent methyltransferase
MRYPDGADLEDVARRPGIAADVAQFYRRFPYPRLSVLRQVHPGHFGVARLNHVLCRRGADRLPDRLRIWIPGAGTTLALHTALNFPEASVLATDLSATSLAISRRLAEALGLRNIVFEVEDLMQAQHEAAFDYVDCAGVINHVEDPVQALRTIGRALAPRGVAAVFVYNAHHRWLSDAWQQAVGILAGEAAPVAQRLQLASRLQRAVRRSPLLGAIQAPLAVLEQEADLSAFADTLLHPHEVSFTIDQLYALVAASGLRFAAWRMPHEWDIGHYLQAPERLAERALLASESSRLVWALTREDSPLFDCYLERSDWEGGQPWSPEELLQRRVVAYHGATYHTIREGRLHSRWHCDALREQDGRSEIMLNEDSREKSQQWRALSRPQAELLRRAQEGLVPQTWLDGGARVSRAALLAHLRALLDPRCGVLA